MYVNKSAKAKMMSNEGRILEINNEDSMRAIVGEIVCGSRSARARGFPRRLSLRTSSVHPIRYVLLRRQIARVFSLELGLIDVRHNDL